MTEKHRLERAWKKGGNRECYLEDVHKANYVVHAP